MLLPRCDGTRFGGLSPQFVVGVYTAHDKCTGVVNTVVNTVVNNVLNRVVKSTGLDWTFWGTK